MVGNNVDHTFVSAMQIIYMFSRCWWTTNKPFLFIHRSSLIQIFFVYFVARCLNYGISYASFLAAYIVSYHLMWWLFNTALHFHFSILAFSLLLAPFFLYVSCAPTTTVHFNAIDTLSISFCLIISGIFSVGRTHATAYPYFHPRWITTSNWKLKRKMILHSMATWNDFTFALPKQIQKKHWAQEKKRKKKNKKECEEQATMELKVETEAKGKKMSVKTF